MSKQQVRILVVDDEPIILSVFRHLLGSRGYAVDAVLDLSEAMGMVRQHHYDLVLSDYLLSGGTGLELIRLVREQGWDIPCVIISAECSDAAAEKELRYSVLTKPVDGALLLETASRLLGETMD